MRLEGSPSPHSYRMPSSLPGLPLTGPGLTYLEDLAWGHQCPLSFPFLL